MINGSNYQRSVLSSGSNRVISMREVIKNAKESKERTKDLKKFNES